MYWLNTAIWQVGQRQIFCFLLPRGTGTQLRLAGEQLDAVGLDQQVDHEGAPRLPLAVQAVAAMDEERLGREPVANLTARAASCEPNAHPRCVDRRGADDPSTLRASFSSRVTKASACSCVSARYSAA